MNYLFVIGGVLLVIALYFLYLYFTNDNLVSGIQNLSEPKTTPARNLDSPGSTIFSYQFWVFITQPTTEKMILKRNTGDTNKFNVKLNGTALNICDGSKNLYTATNHFPIQKWTYVTVNYSASSNISECYINGKLVYTINLTNAFRDPANSDQLVIGTAGLNGYITKVIYKPETISSDQVWKNYLQGNGQLSVAAYFAGYNLNMAISKDDVVQKNWKLFA